MDQGLAAVIAGAFGLVGAAVGGAAAAWGARVGAEKTALATRQQVRDQAEAEHAHWLRQQRLEAYEGFLSAFEAHSRIFLASYHARETRRSHVDSEGDRAQLLASMLTPEEIEAFGDAAQTMRERATRISIVGPPRVEECAERLVRAAYHDYDRYREQRRIAELENPSQRDLWAMINAFADFEDIRAIPTRREQFLTAVGQVLGSPPGFGRPITQHE